ncbi:MAG: hypothetical protein SCALA702_29140 [Melioribacteraceae bacterium]|nr:MAG: hypothetical protein SCALA702_29140 [Melioribacteraceae bacterium]
MELIPLIADALLYLLGLLVIIIVYTVVAKKLRKKSEEEPEPKKTSEIPVSIEPDNKIKPQAPPVPKADKIEKPGGNFLDGKPEQKKTQPKGDFLSSGATKPKNITIKPKDTGDDLFKVKEEKSNARRYKPRQNKSMRDSAPRFQILNEDFGKNDTGSDEKDNNENQSSKNNKNQT